jgi:hypothetical protein
MVQQMPRWLTIDAMIILIGLAIMGFGVWIAP